MVSPATVRLWASKGDLNAVATPGGHRRFRWHDIEQFAHARNLTLNRPGGNRLRILIVDDDEQVGTYLSRLLRRLDEQIEVEIARNGFDAGRMVQSFRPGIVLLDLMMPALNGFDVCRQIKDDPGTFDIRVIAMTGFFDDENVRRAIEAGAECCVKKPFDVVELIQVLGLDSDNSFADIAVTRAG